MPFIRLQEQDYAKLLQSMAVPSWTVACFCAQWCGACRNWLEPFAGLSGKYPDATFVWIDIEDHADLLGDLDIDNFPCLLVQYDDTVCFFGAIHPEPKVLERLFLNHYASRPEEMRGWVMASPERVAWQDEANLRQMLSHALGA